MLPDKWFKTLWTAIVFVLAGELGVGALAGAVDMRRERERTLAMERLNNSPGDMRLLLAVLKSHTSGTPHDVVLPELKP